LDAGELGAFLALTGVEGAAEVAAVLVEKAGGGSAGLTFDQLVELLEIPPDTAETKAGSSG
jgi:hypothetical protein